MNCTICGTQIPMGQPNCPNCGAMVQQPVQPMQPMGGYQQPVQPMQPMGGYQQPMGQPQQMNYQQPMGQPQQMGYQQPMQQAAPMGGINANAMVGALKGDVMKLAGLIGAFLIFISPFFTWLKLEVWGDKESGNLFDIADIEDCGIFGLFAFLLLIVGAAIMFWDLADYAPAFAKVKMSLARVPYFELILCGIALIVLIACLAHGELNDYIDLVENFGGDASRGFGPVVGFLGLIAATAPRVCNMLGIKIGK